jgi:hypothetical protein
MRITVFVAAFAWAASALAAAPERKVVAHTIYSPRNPRVEVHVPENLKYVGSDTFALTKPDAGEFDVCELYAFADADRNGSLRKLYWVHFEHLLPNHPEMHMTYDSPRHARIGGLDFFVDTEFSDGTGIPKPGSDTEHFYRLLSTHGYKRSPMMFVRLVHLTDASARKELMLIVGEALPAGVTSATLKEGGKDHDRLPSLEKGVIDSAARRISITAVR